MSVNLTLLFDERVAGMALLAYRRLPLTYQDNQVFDRIRDDAKLLDTGILWYGDAGIEPRNTNQYGEPLTGISAHELVGHLKDVPKELIHDTALLAYLRALPPFTRVILWWT